MFQQRPLLLSCLVFGMLLAVAPGLALATPQGFYLGAGYASQSVSGGLDGKKGFADATDSVAILAGKPDAGTGLAFIGGFAFSPQASLDVLIASTSHSATHEVVDLKSNMTLFTTIIAIRYGQEVVENLELYGRFGLASATATYAKYALEGTNVTATGTYSSTSEASFSGSGFAFGGGIDYFIGQLAIGASYNILNVSFDSGEGGGVSGELSSSLSSTINTLAITLTYYFKQ